MGMKHARVLLWNAFCCWAHEHLYLRVWMRMKLQSSQETHLCTCEATLLHAGSVLRMISYVYTLWCGFPSHQLPDPTRSRRMMNLIWAVGSLGLLCSAVAQNHHFILSAGRNSACGWSDPGTDPWSALLEARNDSFWFAACEIPEAPLCVSLDKTVKLKGLFCPISTDCLKWQCPYSILC